MPVVSPAMLHDALAECEQWLAWIEFAIPILERAQGSYPLPNHHSHRLAEHRYARHVLSERAQQLALLIHHRKDAQYVATLL